MDQKKVQKLIHDLEKEMATSKNAVQNAKSTDNGGKFILNPNELAGLSSARGRKATDSVYLEDVKAAMDKPTSFAKNGELETGDVHAIRITVGPDARTASWIDQQLRKAAKQLDLDAKRFTVRQRPDAVSDYAPNGYVAYWVKPEDSESDSEESE